MTSNSYKMSTIDLRIPAKKKHSKLVFGSKNYKIKFFKKKVEKKNNRKILNLTEITVEITVLSKSTVIL